MAERFKLVPSSDEYTELFDAAYAGRFGKNPAEHVPTLELFVSKNRSPVGGLSGLPVELTPPNSAAGEYYRSQGIDVGQGLDRAVPGRQTTPPQAQSKQFVPIPEPIPWHQVMELLGANGIQLVSFQQTESKAKRSLQVKAILRFPDGKRYEVKASLQPVLKRSGRKTAIRKRRPRVKRAGSRVRRRSRFGRRSHVRY
jgi:hypothetical protein